MEKGTELVTTKRLTPKPSPGDRPACSILADQVSYEKTNCNIVSYFIVIAKIVKM